MLTAIGQNNPNNTFRIIITHGTNYCYTFLK
nr:MAG TPA: hypothetical protein [Caudoviricetes sp.]